MKPSYRLPSNPTTKSLAVVKLDDPRCGAGPGTVLEVAGSGDILALRQRYADRDGVIPADLRFWSGSEGVAVGDRVAAKQDRQHRRGGFMSKAKSMWIKDSEARLVRAEKALVSHVRAAFHAGKTLPDDIRLAAIDLVTADEILAKAQAAG